MRGCPAAQRVTRGKAYIAQFVCNGEQVCKVHCRALCRLLLPQALRRVPALVCPVYAGQEIQRLVLYPVPYAPGAIVYVFAGHVYHIDG